MMPADPIHSGSPLLQPVPCVHNVYRVRIQGQEFVALQFHTQSGTAVVFYPPTQAKELAETIRATALGLSLVTPTINGKDG